MIPDYATSWVHVEMEPASDSLVLPTCGKVVRGSRRLSYGRFGLRFDLSKQMTVSGGHDVDYAEYVIRAQSGDAALQLWFGPDAIGSEPDDHYFIDSASFDQRWVVDEKGAIVGIDSSGLLRSGTRWRWMSVSALGGAVYERASVRDRTFFDQIIGAACLESWQPMK
ncbi:MAG TPA: hypothetical protein VE994_10955 [Terriglobales bacterium]|nr:hypothetical protein [Terriglobales bacterium]